MAVEAYVPRLTCGARVIVCMCGFRLMLLMEDFFFFNVSSKDKSETRGKE